MVDPWTNPLGAYTSSLSESAKAYCSVWFVFRFDLIATTEDDLRFGGIWEQSMHAGNEEYLEEFLYNFVYLFFPLFLICSLEEKSKKLDYQSIMNQWVGVVSTNWISHVPTYSPSFIQPCLCSTNFIQNHRGITKFNKSLLGIFVRYKEKSWQ